MEAIGLFAFSALLPWLLAVDAFGQNAVSSLPDFLGDVALQYETATDYVIRAEAATSCARRRPLDFAVRGQVGSLTPKSVQRLATLAIVTVS